MINPIVLLDRIGYEARGRRVSGWPVGRSLAWPLDDIAGRLGVEV